MESPNTEIILLLGIIEFCCKTKKYSDLINKKNLQNFNQREHLNEREKNKANEKVDILKCRDC